MATRARVKTLNIFRQIHPQHNIRIIRFLYEAGQLIEAPEHHSLDLSKVELHDTKFHFSQ
jgi:hypothetical protein